MSLSDLELQVWRNNLEVVRQKCRLAARIHPELIATPRDVLYAISELQEVIAAVRREYERTVLRLLGDDDGAGNPRSKDHRSP